MTSVGVVVPVHGAWAETAALLDDLGACPEVDEVLVVDDASPTQRLAQTLAGRPRVRGIRREVQGGFAAAVNTGVAQVRGDVVVVCNSDLRLSRVALAALVATALEGVVAGPDVRRLDGTPVPTARRFPTVRSMLADAAGPLRLLGTVDERWSRRDRRPEDPDVWLSGACLAAPRGAWDDVGALDERFGMSSEDVDWQRRAAARGWERRFVDVPVQHVGGGSSGGSERVFMWAWRANHLYARKWFGRRHALVLRVGLLGTWIASLPLWLAAWPFRRRWAPSQVRLHLAAAVVSRHADWQTLDARDPRTWRRAP